jgi:hypothetical protein
MGTLHGGILCDIADAAWKGSTDSPHGGPHRSSLTFSSCPQPESPVVTSRYAIGISSPFMVFGLSAARIARQNDALGSNVVSRSALKPRVSHTRHVVSTTGQSRCDL